MFFSKSKSNHRWDYLRNVADFENLISASDEKPLVIFKHSTRCPISSMALDRFNDAVSDIADLANLVMVDVIDDRPLSLHIADVLQITHQSPQVIVVSKQEAIYDNSHNGIQGKSVLSLLQNLNND